MSQRQRAFNGVTTGKRGSVVFMMQAFTVMVLDGIDSQLYIIMVLRIRPTANPSISKGSPGSTTMVW